jgi:acetyltransferase-like isoleucine patch superfamily enzyme
LIHVEENVFLAWNVIVLPGVTIGKNVFAAIGTLVDKDVGRDLVVAGNPMEIVGQRFPQVER